MTHRRRQTLTYPNLLAHPGAHRQQEVTVTAAAPTRTPTSRISTQEDENRDPNNSPSKPSSKFAPEGVLYEFASTAALGSAEREGRYGG